MRKYYFATLCALLLHGGLMALTLKSPAFTQGTKIPSKYTCEGEDVSPPLSWDDVPEGTKSFALIMDDPDAPRGTWVHWVIYNIPVNVRELQEGVSTDPVLTTRAKQGMNDFRKTGYGGPCPPPGPEHRYFFKLYALKIELALSEKATKADVEDAMNGNILAETELMGKFGR